MDRTEIITTWYKNIKNKKNKVLLLYGNEGCGKTSYIEKGLNKRFKIKNITNENLDNIKDEKDKNDIINFLDNYFRIFFKMIINKNEKPILMVINENKLYNFDRYDIVINKLIDINNAYRHYPMIIIINSNNNNKNKFLLSLKKKCEYIEFEELTDNLIKLQIIAYMKKYNMYDKSNINNKNGPTKALTEELIKISNNNLNKLFILLDNLRINYCIKNENNDYILTKNSLNDFKNEVIENDIKKNIYISGYKLLTTYKSIEDALNIFSYDEMYNPLIMEEWYYQKLEAYEYNNKNIWNNKEMRNIVKRLINSFSYSNLYDGFIFNYQRWDLKKIYGYFSCALPSYLLSLIKLSYNPIVEYPNDMTRTSNQKINTKNILNMYEKLDILNIDYYLLIGEYIKNIIEIIKKNKKDNNYYLAAYKLNQFAKFYNIDLKIIGRIMNINKINKKDKKNKIIDDSETEDEVFKINKCIENIFIN